MDKFRYPYAIFCRFYSYSFRLYVNAICTGCARMMFLNVALHIHNSAPVSLFTFGWLWVSYCVTFFIKGNPFSFLTYIWKIILHAVDHMYNDQRHAIFLTVKLFHAIIEVIFGLVMKGTQQILIQSETNNWFDVESTICFICIMINGMQYFWLENYFTP